MSFKNPIYPTIGWQFCSSKRSTCHTLITPQSLLLHLQIYIARSTDKTPLRLGKGMLLHIPWLHGFTGSWVTKKKTAVRGCLWSLQWFCRAPGKKKPRLPQTPNEEIPKQKLLLKGQGNLQGVCGWDLRFKDFPFTQPRSKVYFTQHCLVWCLVVFLWWDCFPLRSPTKLVHEKQHIISELERVAPKYLPSNQFSFIYLAFPTQGKKTRKTQKSQHTTPTTKKNLSKKNEFLGTRRPAGSYSAWSSRSSKSPPKHPTDFDAFDSMSSLDEFGFLTHQWSGYQ